MKKLFILFAALVILAAFGSVFAQTDAPLDMTVAEPFLGTWYMSELCGQGQCMDASALGMSSMAVEFKDDKTMTVAMGEEEAGAVPWYTENGTAYACNGSEEEGCIWLPMNITEDGKLSMGDDTSSMVLIRDEIKPFGTAEVKADASYEDFQGEWFLESMISEGVTIPASMFGMQAKLVIREDGFDFSLTNPMSPEESDGVENAAYELKDGSITAEINDGDKTETVTMEYHIDESVVMSMEEGNLVFVREENLTTGPSLLDMFSESMGGESANSGNRVEIGTTGLSILIPEDYVSGELTEEDIADDMIAYYYSDAHLMDFDIYQFPSEGQSLEEYARAEAAEYGVEEITWWGLNDIEGARYYSSEEYDGQTFPCVTYILVAGDDFAEIAFWLDGEDAEDLADNIIYSLKN
ncbi:MAG: hypothetical protein IJI57_08915 [Flexilinea sp.]|nr:hypothetical protein [Flexilinea sp.]